MDSAEQAAMALLEECRRVVRPQAIGFSGKTARWAHPEEHALPVEALASELAARDARRFFIVAREMFEQYADVANPWPLREHVRDLFEDLVRGGNAAAARFAGGHLVGNQLGLRYWAYHALLLAPPRQRTAAFMRALPHIYRVSEQLLLVRGMARPWPPANRHRLHLTLRDAALYAPSPEQRRKALGLLAELGSPAEQALLQRIATADPDEALRAAAIAALRATLPPLSRP